MQTCLMLQMYEKDLYWLCIGHRNNAKIRNRLCLRQFRVGRPALSFIGMTMDCILISALPAPLRRPPHARTADVVRMVWRAWYARAADGARWRFAWNVYGFSFCGYWFISYICILIILLWTKRQALNDSSLMFRG